MRPMLRFFPLIALLLFASAARALELTQIDLPVNDIVFNKFDGWLYVSVPSAASTRGNTITRIDPVTGTLGASLPIGSEPKALALSDDGTRLYVALGGAATVRPVDLVTFTAGTAFTLGNDQYFGPNYAEDIAVQPGHPNVVAISLMNPGISPRHAGVAVFEDGVARASVTARHTGSNRIEFSSDPARLYGYNNETTEYGFRRMNVTATGVSVLDVTQSLLSGFSIDIRYDHGRIYTTNGQVADPETRTLLGRFTLPDYAYRYAVAPDSDKVYFATGEGGGLQLGEYEATNFTLVLRQGIPGISGGAAGLVRWGTDGLAMRTVDLYGAPQRVVILKRIHEPPMADLAVTQRDGTDPLNLGSPITYTVTVRNLGPSAAADVVLRDLHPAGYQYSYSSRGSCYDSSGTVVCALGGIANDDSATVWVSVVPPATGTIENRAWVASSTLDPESGNNTSVESTVVRTPPSADAFLRVVAAPAAATVNQVVTITLRAGNLGPDLAEASQFVASTYYGVPAEVLSIRSPRDTCLQGISSSYLDCGFGDLAAGDSFTVVVTLLPRAIGALNANFNLFSPVADPVPGNASAYATMPVVPSAGALIVELLSLVYGLELKNGPEHTLVENLKSARDAIRDGDTTGCCSGMTAFRDEVERRAGRALTVPQAYSLLEGADRVAAVLDCGSRGKRTVKVAEGVPTADASAEPTDPIAVERLAIRWVGEPETGRVLEWALPTAGWTVVDLHDVQGRKLGVLHDGELSAGTHRLAWDGRSVEGKPLPSGVYFLRVSSGGRSAVMKTVLVQ